MTAALVRYDLLIQAREHGTWMLLAAAMLMAWFGLWQGAAFTRTAQAVAASVEAQEASALHAAQTYAATFFAEPDSADHQEARWFRNVADIRGYAFREHTAFAVKPPMPGAALAIGQSDLLPGYSRVRAESMESVRNAGEFEHPQRLSVGRFDLAFVVLYLWPLVLLAVSISALTADREARRVDTLRLQGVSTLRLLLAQVFGRTIAITMLFIASLALPAFVFAVVPQSMAGGAAIAHWSLVVVMYSLFWAGVAAAVAALSTTRTVAAFAAFGTWVVLTIVLPQILAATVSAVSPLPSREMYLLKQREAVDRVNADRNSIVQRFYDQHPEWRPKSTPLNKVSGPVVRFARAIELERAMAATEAKFDAARMTQASQLRAAMWISPVTVVQTALSQLAGNDARRHDQFIQEVRRYQLALRDFFQAHLQRAALENEATPCVHPSTTCRPGFGFTHHETVPRFSASHLLEAPAVPANLGWLAVWCLALVTLSAYWLRTKSNARKSGTSVNVAARGDS